MKFAKSYSRLCGKARNLQPNTAAQNKSQRSDDELLLAQTLLAASLYVRHIEVKKLGGS